MSATSNPASMIRWTSVVLTTASYMSRRPFGVAAVFATGADDVVDEVGAAPAPIGTAKALIRRAVDRMAKNAFRRSVMRTPFGQSPSSGTDSPGDESVDRSVCSWRGKRHGGA